jgi:ParB-like chromosome segregation protein Spo0J
MELEWHQLDLRYEGLRRRHPAQERQLVASVAELGQQTPIIVISQTSACAH